MLRNIKKLVSLVLVFVLSVVVSSPAFAEETNTDYKDSGTEFITEQEAKNYAIDLIKNGGVKDLIEDWNWNDSTQIDDEVPLFDYDGNINSYLFRLKTNGISQGYIFVNAIKSVAGVESFSDVGEHPVDIMAKKQLGHTIKKTDNIINAGLLNYAVEKESKYIRLDTGDQLDSDYNDLENSYENMLSTTINGRKSSDQFRIDATIPTADSLDNISAWTSPYIMTDFGDDNNCTPTALTNFVYYWGNLHPNKKPGLWTGSVYQDLKNYVFWTPFGTPNFMIIPALTNFGESRNIPIVNSDSRSSGSIDWNFISSAIYSNIPVVLNTHADPHYGNHSILAIGFNHSSQPYLQVIDGWERTIHTVYTYNNAASLAEASYVRWA